MQPGKASVTFLFNAPCQYLIPVFQRGYVWTLEKQVAPLWNDIEDRASKYIEHKAHIKKVGPNGLKPIQKHFLGSLVISQVGQTFGRAPAFEVIDGQQRTTSLHLLLLAFLHAARSLPASPLPAMLEPLTRNAGPFPADEDDHHKVWPTKAGRADIKFLGSAVDCAAVCKEYPARQGKRKIERPLMVQAFLYFHHACLAYLRGVSLSDPVRTDTDQSYSDSLIRSVRDDNDIVGLLPERPLDEARAQALYMALDMLVQIMTLSLESEDDPQVIFETLNARGEPLLASDLVRNFVFLEASRNRLSVPKLYADYWQDFDEERDSKGVVMANRYWRERERQGRLTYPRIDLFFYHYTVLVRAQETLVSHVFQSFKEWWQSQAREIATELGRIVTCSSYFQEFISPEGDGHVAEFSRLIKALDVSTIAPVYLALRERLADKDDALKQALADLASFVTRRAICGWTTKNYNKLFLRLLELIAKSPAPEVAVRAYLLGLSGSSQAWPTDEEFEERWHFRPVYDELRPAKCSAILRALELSMRTPLQELSAVPLLPYLTVEHVLPQTWHSSDYPLASPDPQTLALRKMTIQTFGNLTLLTQPLNSSVSNGPFMDRTMNGTLVEGKRSGFRKSLLILNAYFQDPALTQWSDGEIAQRSDVLLRHARRLWPRPVMPQPVATVPTSDPTSA